MMSTKDQAGTPQRAVGSQHPDATPQPDSSLYERLIGDGVAAADARGGAIDHVTARRLAIWLAARPRTPTSPAAWPTSPGPAPSPTR